MNEWLMLIIGLLMGIIGGFFMGAIGAAKHYRNREAENREVILAAAGEAINRKTRNAS